MEVIVEVTFQKESIDEEKQNVETIRQLTKDEIVAAFEPLLQEGWKIHITSSRVIT